MSGRRSRGGRLSRALGRQVSLAVLLASPSSPCPQEPVLRRATPSSLQNPDDLLSATARIRAALDERPFHEQLFDGLVEKALRRSALEDLVAIYAARHEADPEARAPRVLLARLLAHRGELERAEELLAGQRASDTAALLLRARWRERSGDLEQAMILYGEYLEHGSELAETGGLETDERLDVLERLADLQTITGDREGVRSTLERLAREMPVDPESRLLVGRYWGLAGFGDQELDEYRAAVRAAGDDVASRCKALAELGAALETAGRGDEALAAYDEAVAILAPGHWQRAFSFERTLQLRQAQGTLEPWLEQFAVRAAGSGNLADSLDLARVLDRAGCAARAIAVLEQAHRLHPGEGEVQDLLVDLAAREGAHELHVRLRQERVAAAPGQPALRLQLARALRAAGESDAAARTLATAEAAALAAEDPELLQEIARVWADAGALAEAERALNEAATLAPGDALLWIDLAQLELARGDERKARVALSRAEAHAGADDRFALAAAWEDIGDPERAWAELEVMAGSPSCRPSALSELAELALRHGWTSRAREALRELAQVSSGAARSEALTRFTGTFEDSEGALSRVRQERARFEADASDPLPLLIEAFFLERSSASPITALVSYLQRVPDDLHARARLVIALKREGRLDEALEETDRLIARDPAGRAEHRLVAADLLSSLDRVSDALTALELARRDAQRSPDVLRRIASRLVLLGDEPLAVDVLEQVLRLDPLDHASARQLGRLLASSEQPEHAREVLRRAWRHARDDAQRRRTAEELLATFPNDEARAAELDVLQEHVRRSSDDLETPALLAQLLALQGRYTDLQDLARTMMERRPADVDWRLEHVRARLGQGREYDAMSELVQLADEVPIEDLTRRLLDELVQPEFGPFLRELGRRTAEPLEVVKALRERGENRLAAEYLNGHVRAHGAARGELLELSGKLLD